MLLFFMQKKIVSVSLFFIFLLALLIRLNPFFVGTLVDPDGYFHVRNSELALNAKGVPEFDLLSQGGRAYSYAPVFHFNFALLHLVSGLSIEFLVNVFPAFYGALTIFVVFIFARKLFDEKTALFSAFSLSVMVFHFLRTGSNARPDGLSMLFIPVILYLVYVKRFRVAALLSAFQFLLHPLSGLTMLGVLVLWIAVAGFKKMDFDFKAVIGIILVSLIVWFIWIFSLPFHFTQYVSKVSLESAETAKLLFVSVFTFFSFSWIFALIGLFKSKKNFFLLSWIFLTFVIGMWALRLAFYMTVPIALISGAGLFFALNKIKPYRKVFFLLVFALALISVIPSLFGQEKYVPDSEKNAMLFLKENSDLDSLIFSRWDRGHPLAFFAQRKVLIDGYFEFAENLDEKNNAMKEIIVTSNCSKIERIRNEFNFDYFFVNKNALIDSAYINGILDSKHCSNFNLIYSGNGGKIFSFP